MPLPSLPENLFYELLPESVINGDARGILAAVIGGFQDRLGDFRSYASGISTLVDPSSIAPNPTQVRCEYTDTNSGETIVAYLTPDSTTPAQQIFSLPAPANQAAVTWCATELSIDPSTVTYIAYGSEVVLVKFYGSTGTTLTRTLAVDGTTPSGSNATALSNWAAQALRINPISVLSVQYGTDVLFTVDGNFLQLLAASVGALIPVTDADTPEEEIERQRQIVMGYFPRLRIKGTVQSYSLLATNLGFSDSLVTPLWSRLSPHRPEDIGNDENSGDFLSLPQLTIARTLPDNFYDPQDFRDGPFATWPSADDPVQLFSGNPSDTNYLPNAINGKSPFITVAPISGSVIQGIPSSGSYMLTGGDYAKNPYVDFPEANMRVSALAPGTSFNGMFVTAQTVATGSGSFTRLSVTDRLSSVKYRSSYYDIVLAQDINTAPVLISQPNAESLNAGSCQSGRPLGGGLAAVDNGSIIMNGSEPLMVLPRLPIDPSSYQVDYDFVQTRAHQALDDLESVRPATRTYRQTMAGYAVVDLPAYSPFPNFYEFLNVSQNGSFFFQGTVPTNSRPPGEFTGNFYLVQDTGTLPLMAESDLSNPTGILLKVGTTDFYGEATGSFDFSLGNYWFKTSNIAQYGSASIRATWAALPNVDTGTVAQEPSHTLKELGQVSPSLRPEDELDLDLPEFVDDYPWLNKPSIDGTPVDSDSFSTALSSSVTPVQATPSLRDQNGAEYLLYVNDSTSSAVVPKITTVLLTTVGDGGAPLSPVYYEYAFAFQGSNTLRLGLFEGIPVGTPDSFYRPSLRTGLVCWMPFSEHPDDDLQCTDLTPIQDTPIYSSNTQSTDRVWSAERGWVLDFPSNRYIESDLNRALISPFFVCFAINPLPESGGIDQTILTVGNQKIIFTLSAADVVTGFARLYAATSDVSVGYVDIPVSAFTFVFFNFDGTTVSLGTGTLETSCAIASSASSDVSFDNTDTGLSLVNGNGREFLISDLRIFNTSKTLMEANHINNPTQVSLPFPSQSYFGNVIGSDQYRFQVLSNGRAYPSATYQPQDFVSTKRLQRYAAPGLYVGDPAFDQVGLEGGPIYDSPYPLGISGLEVSAHGRIVVSTTDGQLPGQASPANTWPLGTPGFFLSVSNGSTVLIAAPTSDPWPNNMATSNAAQQAIFIQGDETTQNSIFLASLQSIEGSIQLSVVPVATLRASLEQFLILKNFLTAPTSVFMGYIPVSQQSAFIAAIAGCSTDAAIISTCDQYGISSALATSTITASRLYLSSNFFQSETITDVVTDVASSASSSKLSVRYDGSIPIAYVTDYSGTISRPVPYLYLNTVQEVAVNGQETVARFLPQSGLTGPSRQTAGSLDFYNQESLPAGNYNFTLSCGNTGQLDTDFDGFDLTVTVGATNPITQFSVVALPSPSTPLNPQGTVTVQFQLAQALNCPWVLSIAWSNPRVVSTAGTQRQFTVYGYELDLIQSSLYSIDLHAPGESPSFTLVETGSNPAISNTPPGVGAWIGYLNSNGEVATWVHESDPSTAPASIVPTETSANVQYPLSLLWTGSTEDRTESLIVDTPYILPDDVPPLSPNIISINSSGTLTSDGTHYFNGSNYSTGTLFQVGLTQYFSVSMQGPFGPVPAPISYSSGTYSGDLSYVWNFWDGSVQTTQVPATSKILNRGGSALSWNILVVDEIGQSASQTSAIGVNSPPVFTAFTVSSNDLTTPYTTTVTATASDPEGNSLTWSWFDLGPNGTGYTPINASYYPGGSVLTNYPVTGTGTDVMAVVSDGAGGVSSMTASLRGTPLQPPSVSSIGSSGDGNPPSSLGFIIESITNLYFYIVGTDPQGYPITFNWTQNGTPLSSLPGVTSTVYDNGDGSFTSEIVVPVTSLSAGSNIPITCTVVSTPTGIQTPQTASATAFITLIHNEPPIINQISVTPSSLTVEAGTNILYSVSSSSPLGFSLINQWDFTSSPPGGIDPFSLYSTGTNTVSVVTTTLSGFVVSGNLIVKDPYGLTTTAPIPNVSVT